MSLRRCLERMGLGPHEGAILRGKADALKEDGYEAHKAAVEAVKDHISELRTQRADVMSQAQRAPAVPVKQGIGDAFLKWAAPAARGPVAEQMAGIVRHNLAEQAREREVAYEQLQEFAKRFDKMTRENRYSFIEAMEGGLGRTGTATDPQLNAAAKAIAKLLDTRRESVAALGTGKLEHFIENYFPHIWEDTKSAQSYFASRRPLEGPKGFLKQRIHKDFMDGINAGLKPITSNPVGLALLKAREMDRYIYGQKIFAEMKAAGLAKVVAYDGPKPEGWIPINDKIAQSGSAGRYYAPEKAGTIINNHLSPGLQGDGIYDIIRKSGNMLNAAQLGLSAFHMGFTTADSMISKTALGIMQVSRGIVTASPGDVGRGSLNVLQGVLNPLQPFINIYKGDRLLRAYLGNLTDPGLAAVVSALTAGGGRVYMDDFYRGAAAKALKQALQEGQYGRAAQEFLPTVLDKIMWPIMQWLVPRQKLGVFFDMAQDAMQKYPGMDDAQQRVRYGKLWDSVDNRLGQLAYDNLFWHRTLKDVAMVSVRSVGWNIGTFRELGGGIKDVLDLKKVGKEGLSSRTSYLIGLVITTAIWGAILQYLMTGEGPKELKDYFFPRTGKTRTDGTLDRVSLPTYMKDVAAYTHDIAGFLKYGSDPMQTIFNKMHPLWSMIYQMLNNKDFFGAAIRSPGDAATKQLWDEARYLGAQLSPFGVRNYLQQQKTKNEPATPQGYVTSPSFVGITPAPGYITKTPEQAESSAIAHQKDALIAKYRQQLRDGSATPVEVRQAALRSGLKQQEIGQIMTATRPYRPGKLRAFSATEP